MLNAPLKTFKHPCRVYHLDYPAHWDHVEQDEARSCGFGPHERDDVGLWISILPMSIDSDRIAEDLPSILEKAMPEFEASDPRKDPTIQHYALKAEVKKEGQGGHYWIVAGGDVVLFASSQVPSAERDVWNPPFEKVMASLLITREDELFLRKLTIEVLEKLHVKYPDEEFEVDEHGIRSNRRVVFLSNMAREVKSHPERRESTIDYFLNSLDLSAQKDMGSETWEDAQLHLIPVLKPKDYIAKDGPTQHMHFTPWVGGVIICYALKTNNIFRFVTGWDVNRWGTDNQTLHRIAIENLCKLSWPERMEGSREKNGGRVILLMTDDSLASSRLLHPDLHQLFSGPLGNPFWAGIPDRNTLVLFSDRRQVKQRIIRRLRIDHKTSTYPISPRPLLVTRDGIARGE